jgi:hypothetical protein
MGTAIERVLAAIHQHPGLDDDELSEFLDLRPRQAVNRAARVLMSRRLVRRVTGPRGKLVNLPAGADDAGHTRPVRVSPPARTPPPAPAETEGYRPLAPPSPDRVVPTGDRLSPVVRRRIALVGCVKQKLEHPAPARDLYTSDLFRKRVAHAAATCGSWLILSAKHGLVDPDRVLAPYDLETKRLPAVERCAWSSRVLQKLLGRFGSLEGLTFEVHAGREYWDYGLATGLRAVGAKFENPLEGLSIGQQKSWYLRHATARVSDLSQEPSTRS